MPTSHVKNPIVETGLLIANDRLNPRPIRTSSTLLIFHDTANPATACNSMHCRLPIPVSAGGSIRSRLRGNASTVLRSALVCKIFRCSHLNRRGLSLLAKLSSVPDPATHSAMVLALMVDPDAHNCGTPRFHDAL